jgi:mannose-6-phosphate isomerase-like protein (cupin superfamily)
MEYFEIVNLEPGETRTLERKGKKEKLIVGRGRCRIKYRGLVAFYGEGANLDIVVPEGEFELSEARKDTTVIRMCGRWGDETGGSGIFGVKEEENATDPGDPVDYPKKSTFDSHYHDCDEYWILFEGRGIAVSEGKSYEVGPGDCVATGMGHHHDFPRAFEPVRAVYFETTLEGKKRRGHLVNHKHGPAQPAEGRI